MPKKENNANVEAASGSDQDRLFRLYLARCATVDTRLTMRTDISSLFKAAFKEAKMALAVFEEEVGRE